METSSKIAHRTFNGHVVSEGAVNVLTLAKAKAAEIRESDQDDEEQLQREIEWGVPLTPCKEDLLLITDAYLTLAKAHEYAAKRARDVCKLKLHESTTFPHGPKV